MDEPTNFPPPMPSVPPKTPGARKPFLLGLATGIAAASLAAGGLFLALGDEEEPQRPAAADSKPTATAADVEAVEETTEEPEELYNGSPTPDDFTVTLKTARKQCFGSAGCNVTVDPEVSYEGLLPPDPDKVYSITYEIRGDDSGPVIETMELSNQDELSYSEVSLTTRSNATKVAAKVTDVQISE
ncbi:hypothetical protein [Streptomyces vastus]|uniref:Uncharacterized protein n=1 Tax=Streptomyces vastus TaxID=285451 RepID=A0ABP6CM12_9ACTN